MVGACIITHTCQYCKTLFLDLTGFQSSRRLKKLLDQANRQSNGYPYSHDVSIRHATLAANDGCQFFQLIIGQINSSKASPDDSIELRLGFEDKNVISVHVASKNREMQWVTERHSNTLPTFDFPWFLERFCWFRFFCPWPTFRVFVEKGMNPVASLES